MFSVTVFLGEILVPLYGKRGGWEEETKKLHVKLT